MDFVALRKAMKAVRDLPTLPSVAQQVNQLISDPKTDTARLANVIAADQSISTKVLKVVNSAYYGSQKTNDIHRAINRLGFRAISQLVTNVSICDMFESEGAGRFDRREFWRHSISVAVISKLISQEMRKGSPDEAFTCGLLHDIGKVILDQYMHPEMTKVLDHARERSMQFIDAERATIKLDHTVIGEMAAKKWNLPLLVLVTVRFHHTDLSGRKGIASADDLVVDVVRLADYVVREMDLGRSGDGCAPVWSEALNERLTCPPDVLDRVRGECAEQIDRWAGFIDLPPRPSATPHP